MHKQQVQPRRPLNAEERSGHTPGRVSRLLIGVVGLTPDAPRSAPETVAVTTLGASIILNAVLTSGGLAVLLRFAAPSVSLPAIVGVAIFIGLIAFIADRLCLSTLVSTRQTPKRTVARSGYVLCAAAIAAFTATVTASSVVLVLLAADIDQQIEQTNRATASLVLGRELRAAADHRMNLEDAVAAADQQIAMLDKQLSCEPNPAPDCVSGTGIPGFGSETHSLIDARNEAQVQRTTAADALAEYSTVEQPTILTEQEAATCGLSTVVTITPEKTAQCRAKQLVEAQVSALSSSEKSLLTRIEALEALAHERNVPVGWLWTITAILVFAVGMIPLCAALGIPALSAGAIRKTRGVPGE